MQTLLEIGQAIALKARVRVPATLIGNTDKNASLILLCIQDAAKNLLREYNWTQLIEKVEYTAAYGINSFSLQSDFDRIVDDTVWSSSENDPLLGPLGYDDWQYIENGITSPISSCFSIANADHSAQTVDPEIKFFSISDSNEISFYRVSKNHSYNPDSVDKAKKENYLADTDVSLIDDLCIRQLALSETLQTLGMAYADEKQKYEDMMKERINRDRGSDRVSMNSRRSGNGRRRGRRGYGGACGDPIYTNLPPGGWR